jgi:uncharacterized protein
MNLIPAFPVFAPVSFEMRGELLSFFSQLSEGICENTFASLFLDSCKYHYTISRLSDTSYIVTGIDESPSGTLCNQPADDAPLQPHHFFSIAGDFPDKNRFAQILSDSHIAACCYMKNLGESVRNAQAELFEVFQLHPELDRDNCDYLYATQDLVDLRGKAFHKKKNLVNGFHASYSGTVKPVDDTTAADALVVLNRWRSDRIAHGDTSDGDFLQCSLALQYYKELGLSGIVVYADDTPAGFSLGEVLAGGTMFCTHFEKGIDAIHGIYQVVNNEQAKSLPASVVRINREQDLGDEGLRQAKMTYRPCGFVNKYKVCLRQGYLIEK